MRKIFLSIFIAVASAAAAAKVPLADPFILCDGDTYYAYGTYSSDGIIVFTSKDLRTWRKAGLALRKQDTNVERWFWAPEVYKVGGEYYMYFSGNEHLYVAKAKSPLGPFVQVGEGPMLAEKAIDSSLFRDKHGRPWLTFVRFNDGNNIWVAPLDKSLCRIDTTRMRHCFSVSQGWERSLGRVCEGPCVFRRGRKYYMIYSANDFRSRDYGLGLATSRKPDGPWEKRADNPFLQRPDTLVGAGHNAIFTDREGKLRIVFHAHNSRSRVAPRCMYIGTLQFADPRDRDHLQLVPGSIIQAEEE